MKTLLKSLAVATLLTAGVTAVAPAANAYEVVRERTVIHEGPGYGPGYHRGYYRPARWHRGYRHCERRVWYRHGYRHVVRRCW